MPRWAMTCVLLTVGCGSRVVEPQVDPHDVSDDGGTVGPTSTGDGSAEGDDDWQDEGDAEGQDEGWDDGESTGGPPPDCPDAPPGQLLWLAELEGDGTTWADALAVDEHGDLAVAGTNVDQPVVWRLRGDGGVEWAVTAEVPGEGRGLTLNDAGEPIITWNQFESVSWMHLLLDGTEWLQVTDLEPGRRVEDLAYYDGFLYRAGWRSFGDDEDMEVMKYAADGQSFESDVPPSSGRHRGRGVAVSHHGVFVVGDGGGDFLVAAYDHQLNPRWERSIEGGPDEYATSVAVAPFGDVFVGGTCLDDLEPVTGWLGRFSEIGDDVWKNDFTCFDWPFGPVHDVAVDGHGNPVLATSVDGAPAILGVREFGDIQWVYLVDEEIAPTTVAVDRCGAVTFAGNRHDQAFAGRFFPPL